MTTRLFSFSARTEPAFRTSVRVIRAAVGQPGSDSHVRRTPRGTKMLSVGDHEARLRLPRRIDALPVVLERLRLAHAAPLASAVAESLGHLRPWMPWATSAATDVEGQRARIRDEMAKFDGGEEFQYVITDPASREILGACGLTRKGPDMMVLGYWIHRDHVRKGYATAASRAVTTVALGLSGIARVEIHCDAANTASAAIPMSLGYRLDRVIDAEIKASGETGSTQVWVVGSGDLA